LVFVLVSKFEELPQVSRDKGKHAALICERCSRRVNEANKTIEDIRNSDKEYFEKLRHGENGSMASQEAKAIAEVKIEIDEYRFSDGQAVRKIKEEPVEAKQEERPPVRSLAHTRRVFMEELERCKGSDFGSDQELDAGTVSVEDSVKQNEQEDNVLMQNSDENQAPKEVESSQQQSEHSRTERSKLKLRKRSTEVRGIPLSQLELKRIQGSDRKVLQCQICSKTFPENYKLRRHVESVHDKKTRFKCSQCSKGFYEMHQLKHHLATHEFFNDDTSNSSRPFRCDFDDCGKFFRTKQCLRQHQKSHDNSKRFKCPKCSKDFSRTRSLRAHIQELHDKKTRFECDFCPKVFFSRHSILMHLRCHLIAKRKTPKTYSKPAVMTPLHCPICFKLLANKSCLQKHINTVHEKKINFSCDLCPRFFYFKSHLMNHMTTHIFSNDDTSNSDRPFKCNFKNCGKFFKTRIGLRKHQKCHSGKRDIRSWMTSS
jgi:uncharacterized Zn-finger protein